VVQWLVQPSTDPVRHNLLSLVPGTCSCHLNIWSALGVFSFIFPERERETKEH
jgi:hypothetical protein